LLIPKEQTTEPHHTGMLAAIELVALGDLFDLQDECVGNFVARIAHKVTVLHLGKILAEGSMDEIHNNQMVQDVYLGH